MPWAKENFSDELGVSLRDILSIKDGRFPRISQLKPTFCVGLNMILLVIP